MQNVSVGQLFACWLIHYAYLALHTGGQAHCGSSTKKKPDWYSQKYCGLKQVLRAQLK